MARLPSLYITHGGGPCFWMEFGPPFGPQAFDKLRAYLTGLIASLPERPKAILVISGHWEEARPTVSTAAKPGMLFDYYGFPEHTYHLSYPAPGAPDLAERVRGLLQAAKIDCGTDGTRGFDHGVFVPAHHRPQGRDPGRDAFDAPRSRSGGAYRHGPGARAAAR
jgi:aromatic ring-opening dioxygenase catalytic subunit (LigB family)